MVEGGDQDGFARPDEEPAAEPRRRLVGYAVAGAAVVVALVTIVVALAGSGGDDATGGEGPAGRPAVESGKPDVLPEGGRFPTPEEDVGVAAAARAAGCELRNVRVESKDHMARSDEPIRYKSHPPTSGRHHPVPAEDFAYLRSPDVRRIVHTLEHGRVAIWFKRDLAPRERSSLKAYYDEDSYLILLVPDPTGMKYEVAATAWNRDPRPLGTGRLLGCSEYGPRVFTALEAFKETHRNKGPELIP
jgi:Protein of unknown function (DUF3105)